MTGKYEIEVYNNRVHYYLTVKRNITIIQGDSATGKTELIRLIQDREANGHSSGITLICAAKCTVLTTIDWETRLSSLEQCIIFIDETAHFLKSKRFAELVRGSDNYFVIVSRDPLQQLPYSVEEIYGLRDVSDTQKYKTYKKVYNEMYQLYHFPGKDAVKPEKVIVEDSNAGFAFFSLLFSDRCLSAHGKSNIYSMVRQYEHKRGLVIADGAAFGCEIDILYRYLDSSEKKWTLYLPESFEYLLLISGLVDVQADVINNTCDYADTKSYMSWEEYYTHYLMEVTENTVFQYRKAKLAEAYKTAGAISRIKAVLPAQILMDE